MRKLLNLIIDIIKNGIKKYIMRDHTSEIQIVQEMIKEESKKLEKKYDINIKDSKKSGFEFFWEFTFKTPGEISFLFAVLTLVMIGLSMHIIRVTEMNAQDLIVAVQKDNGDLTKVLIMIFDFGWGCSKSYSIYRQTIRCYSKRDVGE